MDHAPAAAPAPVSLKGPDVAVRGRLLSAALDLFTTKGYASTTVREIVAAAGVSKPALYYYFRNKEGIYLELMREAFEKFSEIHGRIFEEEGNAREKIVRLSLRVFELVRANIGVTRLMYAIYYGPPQGAPFFDFDAVHMKFQDAILRLVGEGIASGEFRREIPEDIMWALIGVLNVAIEVELCHPERGLSGEGIERVLNVILDAVAAQAGTGEDR